MKKLIILLFIVTSIIWADYPDQHRVFRTNEMWERMGSNNNIVLSEDGKTLTLADGETYGSFTLTPDTLPHSFDRGLPSWNGSIGNDDSGFKVSMRFKYGTGWSPWLTVGYWQDYNWSSYGATSYAEGYIDYDYVVLDDFHTIYQWSVAIKRQDASHESPTIDKLSFFASDQRTTDNLNYTTIVNDDPPEIFFPTSFVCQYNVDPEIGGSICSPTSTVLAIRSYDIEVDPYDFAVANYDDYWGIFGIWPRAVQNAAAFQMDGAVTRYRTWSQAYDTLAAGGRVVMSVGLPLYSGHLMMLAGFDDQGDPLVHDPAKQNGYSFEFNKSALSHSWFDKGGVGYTFYLEDTDILALDEDKPQATPERATLLQNFPNPFNPSTTIRFELASAANVNITIFDIEGRISGELADAFYTPGSHSIKWNAQTFATGVYLVQLRVNDQIHHQRITLLK